jgi:hypothetical protein
LGAFGYFGQTMQDAEGNSLATVGALCLAGTVGAIITLFSTVPLSILQWAALRHHVLSIQRGALTIAIGNSLVTGIIIALYSWAIQGGWN